MASSNQDLIESLQKQRQSVKRQFDAVTDELMKASGSERVRLEADRDNLTNQLREIDQQISTLDQAAQEAEIQKLTAILKTFTSSAQPFMAAYQRALTQRTITPDLEDIEALIRHLVSDLNEASSNRTLYRFVVYLFQSSDAPKLPVSVMSVLKQWAKEHIPDQELAAVQDEINREEAERSNQKSCLLVKVYSNSIDEYHVKAWFISDRNKYRQNWPEGAKLVRFDGEAETADTLPADEAEADSLHNERDNPPYPAVKIKTVIQQIHQQCCQTYAEPDLVEIFLPMQLMNSDIDSWRLQEDKIRPLFGTRYPIILRSSDRLTKKYWRKSVHKKKWDAVERLLQSTALLSFREADPRDIDELYDQGERYSDPDQLETRDVIGLKLTQPSAVVSEELDDVFETVLMESALPVMIWVRQSELDLECSSSLNQILGCILKQLPEGLRNHRLEAFRKKQSCHIGNHLSLLWDDPQLIPPDSE